MSDRSVTRIACRLLAIAVLCAGCSSDSAATDGGGADSTAVDTGAPDASQGADTGGAARDTGAADAGIPDVGGPQADVGPIPDIGSLPDTAPLDAAVPDALVLPTPAIKVNTSVNAFYPKMAMDGVGRTVVVWHGPTDIFAQRFASYWARAGGESTVNTTTGATLDHGYPAVGIAADGKYLVAWTIQGGLDGDGDGVFAQWFDVAGTKVGGEVQVNSTTAGNQGFPKVGVSHAGHAVVAWSSPGQDGDGNGVFGQRFDAAGAKVGGELQINTTTAGNQQLADVKVATDGSFVVVWTSAVKPYLRRYDAAGNPTSGETVVGSGGSPSLGMAPSGRFVVAWAKDSAATGWDIHVQRYETSGVAAGPAFVANTSTALDQDYPSVSMAADGSFVVAWESNHTGTKGIYLQRFGPLGTPVGGETEVSTDPNAGQVSVAIDNIHRHTVCYSLPGNVYLRGFASF